MSISPSATPIRPPGRSTMKAVVQDTYGSAAVLQARDIDKPEIGDGEVLVRVRAPASIRPTGRS